MNIIAHNLLAMNAQRQFGIVNTKQAKTTERLSSGYKVNRAADDAAGLAISEKMRRQIRGLSQASENLQEGIGYVQTADGALNEVQDILHRMTELSVQAANGTNTEVDRQYIDGEVQQLKGELDRIFSTTTFNERKIWEVTGMEKVLGYNQVQAVRSRTSSQSLQLTNDNYNVLACNSYKINASEQGVTIAWTGYNGTAYETKTVGWDKLKAGNYAFEMSDYFDKQANPELFDANGAPAFKRRISLAVEETATTDDMIACLDGCSMSGYAGTSLSGRFEASDGSAQAQDVQVAYSSINYGAAYASRTNGTNGFDFDAANDVFLEPTGGGGTPNMISGPTATTVADARISDTGWQFSFEMDGVGPVTATSTSVHYASNDSAPDDENVWWAWGKNIVDGVEHKYQYTMGRTLYDGTLANVMDALTGDKNSATPGLLTAGNQGAADSGGYIDINFSLTSANNFSYGNSNSKSVGNFTLRINVNNTDTEQGILNKINNSLNSSTILDFYTPANNYGYANMYGFEAKTHEIDVPIMGGACEFFVQAGAEAGQHIDIVYDSLSLMELGLHDTNVLTVASSEKAMGDIKRALEKVSVQRANFGAYQNRLEHAYTSNRNVEENTQASESVIRDTDMATAMVQYSNQNILLQAGQAMMAQANQSGQGLLTLLQ